MKANKRFTELPRITHPQKILYSKQNLSKMDLVHFYQDIEEWILPELVNRPLMIKRCPDGVGSPCFYQKHPSEKLPQAVKSVSIKEKGQKDPREYLYIDSLAGLISLVQLGALEFHTWGCRIQSLEFPDRMVFDLDPAADVAWPDVIRVAKKIHSLLLKIHLESFVKTTGGKGLHIVTSIAPKYSWDIVKAFSKMIVDFIVQEEPELYTANMRKDVRPKKIFLDHLRNARGSTFITSYSTRANEKASVAVPLAWEELTPRIRSDYFTVKNLPKRLASLRRDPWEKINSLKQKLPENLL
ncbi:MAG: ykoU [Bacteriovoracaceae bacterium]|nr:ykoU [Bacteriovoracaceae bacterium]